MIKESVFHTLPEEVKVEINELRNMLAEYRVEIIRLNEQLHDKSK